MLHVAALAATMRSQMRLHVARRTVKAEPAEGVLQSYNGRTWLVAKCKYCVCAYDENQQQGLQP